MQSTKIWFAAFGLTLAVPSLAHAEPQVLQPTSPWKVDYADDECRLLRDFGAGQSALTLRFARGSGLDSFDSVLAGVAIPKLPSRLKVELKLTPQGTVQSIEGYSMGLPNRPERFIRWFDADPSLLQQLSANQLLTFSSGEAFAVTLNLTGARAAMAALDACHVDLLASWGLDIAALKAAKARPKPLGNPGNWATTNDYPRDSFRKGETGTVTFLAVIGPDGIPTQCKVAKSSGVSSLDTTTCQLIMRRARFTPAEDANGKPITGYYVTRVRWLLPDS